MVEQVPHVYVLPSCPSCKDFFTIYNKPVILPCKHKICELCVKMHFDEYDFSSMKCFAPSCRFRGDIKYTYEASMKFPFSSKWIKVLKKNETYFSLPIINNQKEKYRLFLLKKQQKRKEKKEEEVKFKKYKEKMREKYSLLNLELESIESQYIPFYKNLKPFEIKLLKMRDNQAQIERLEERLEERILDEDDEDDEYADLRNKDSEMFKYNRLIEIEMYKRIGTWGGMYLESLSYCFPSLHKSIKISIKKAKRYFIQYQIDVEYLKKKALETLEISASSTI